MDNSLTVSPLKPNEADSAADLIRRVVVALPYYNERARIEELAKYSPAELVRSTEADPQSVLLAHEGGETVGFCLSRYDDGVLWLSWFGTDPAVRGRGVGTKLLQALARTLDSRRTHKIWCDTRTDNDSSQRVLQRFGFRRIAELRNHWYGQDFYLWEWTPP